MVCSKLNSCDTLDYLDEKDGNVAYFPISGGGVIITKIGRYYLLYIFKIDSIIWKTPWSKSKKNKK